MTDQKPCLPECWKDTSREAAARHEEEEAANCPEDQSCIETIKALRAELAAAKERVEELESMLLRNSCLARVCECGTSSELCGEANDIRANRKKEESK